MEQRNIRQMMCKGINQSKPNARCQLGYLVLRMTYRPSLSAQMLVSVGHTFKTLKINQWNTQLNCTFVLFGDLPLRTKASVLPSVSQLIITALSEVSGIRMHSPAGRSGEAKSGLVEQSEPEPCLHHSLGDLPLSSGLSWTRPQPLQKQRKGTQGTQDGSSIPRRTCTRLGSIAGDHSHSLTLLSSSANLAKKTPVFQSLSLLYSWLIV